MLIQASCPTLVPPLTDRMNVDLSPMPAPQRMPWHCARKSAGLLTRVQATNGLKPHGCAAFVPTRVSKHPLETQTPHALRRFRTTVLRHRIHMTVAAIRLISRQGPCFLLYSWWPLRWGRFPRLEVIPISKVSTYGVPPRQPCKTFGRQTPRLREFRQNRDRAAATD